MSFGARVWVGGLVMLTLVGCGSSEAPHAPASGGTSALGGNPAHLGGSQSVGGSGSGSGSGDSTSGAANSIAEPVELAFSWNTFDLRGSEKTPLTCLEIGAETLGVSVSGGSLETTLNWYSSGDGRCEKGSYENFRWEYGPGEYDLRVTLYTGSVLDDDRVALVSGHAALSIPPGALRVTVPELELLRIVMPYYWSIEKGGEKVSCDDVAAKIVELQLAMIKGNESTKVTWTTPCGQSPKTTEVGPGEWELTATLQSSTETLATWHAPQKLAFTTESAAVPPEIVFQVP